MTSLSKSCSDKIALKECTSLLSGITSLLISPENAYLDTLILPTDQYLAESCKRAFGSAGRMASVQDIHWPSTYAFRPFQVKGTDLDLSISRKSAHSKSDVIKGSNLSAVWTPYMQEILINGVLQGRKQGDPKGASMLSRKKMAEQVCSVVPLCEILAIEHVLLYTSYKAMKASRRLSDRHHVKTDVISKALKDWVKNSEDDFSMTIQRTASSSSLI